MGRNQLRLAMAFSVAMAILAWVTVPMASYAASPGPFEEVPARSWPYAVMDHFAGRGFVRGYGGGLYTEGRTLTRYELGLMTAQIIDHLSTAEAVSLDDREVQWLQSLAKEYHRELYLLGYRLEADGLPLPASGPSLALRTAKRQEFRSWLAGTGSPFLAPAQAAPSPWSLAGNGAGQQAAAPAPGAVESAEDFRLAPPIEVLEPSLSVERASLEPGPGVAGAGGGGGQGDGGLVPQGGPGSGGPVLGAAAFTEPVQGGGNQVRLGARATIGVVERAGDGWVPPPAFPSPTRFDQSDEDLRSYELILDLGDQLRVAAARPLVASGLAAGDDLRFPGPVVVSPGVSLVPRIQAGNWALYEEVNDLRTTTASKAGIDMDLVIPSARLRLGWRYEGILENAEVRGGRRTVAGMEYQLDSRAQAVAGIAFSNTEDSATRTTQFGLRYALGRDSSVLFGYRLIDFTKLGEDREDGRASMATAEFSIRF